MPGDDDSPAHSTLHALGDAIGAAVAGVANTLGQTVGTAVQAANKVQEATVHVLPGAGTGLTAEEYVQHAPNKHVAPQQNTTLKASEKDTLDALQSDKTGVAIAHGQDLSAPVSGEQARPKVQTDPVPDDAASGLPHVTADNVAGGGNAQGPPARLGHAVAEAVGAVAEQAGHAADAVVDVVVETVHAAGAVAEGVVEVKDEVVDVVNDTAGAVAEQAAEVKDQVAETVRDAADQQTAKVKDNVAAGAAGAEDAAKDLEAAVHGGHKEVADDDEVLRALLDRPPPEGFVDPIAKIPLHHEPAPSLHLPGEQEDAQDPFALPDHLDRGATEAAWNAPERPGDTGDPSKPSFAAVVAKRAQ